MSKDGNYLSPNDGGNELLAITEKISKTLDDFELVYADNIDDDYLQALFDDIANLGNSELKSKLHTLMHKYREMTESIEEVEEERTEVLHSLGDWFQRTQVNYVFEESGLADELAEVEKMDERATEYQKELDEEYATMKFGLDKLKHLSDEIRWSARRGYPVKDLEEEKKNLEKKVIEKFKGFSQTFASANTLKQVQNEQIRQTMEQEIKAILASDELDRAVLEEKVGGLMRMAQKQDAYTRQMEKDLLDTSVNERKWRKEHGNQTQQKARLMEMNTRLRKELQDTQNQLHKYEKQLAKYECEPTTSESEDESDGEVDSDEEEKRSRTPSLEQLRRAQEKEKQKLEGSKQDLAEAEGSSLTVDEPKPKSGKKKKKRKKSPSMSKEPDEPSLQVPQIADGKQTGADPKSVTLTKDDLTDEVKLLLTEIKSLDDTIDKLESDALELRAQLKKNNATVDQKNLYYDGKLKKRKNMRGKKGGTNKTPSIERLDKIMTRVDPRSKYVDKGMNTVEDPDNPESSSPTGRKNSKRGGKQKAKTPEPVPNAKEIIPVTEGTVGKMTNHDLFVQIELRDKRIDQASSKYLQLEEEVKKFETTAAKHEKAVIEAKVLEKKQKEEIEELSKKLSEAEKEREAREAKETREAEESDAEKISEKKGNKKSGKKTKKGVKGKMSASESPDVSKGTLDVDDIPEKGSVVMPSASQLSVAATPKPQTEDVYVQTDPPPPPKDEAPLKVPSQTKTPVSQRSLLLDFDVSLEDVNYEQKSLGFYMLTGTNPAEIRTQSMACSDYLNTQLKQILESIAIFSFNAKMLVDRELKSMGVANERLLTVLSKNEQYSVKNRTPQPSDQEASFQKGLKYVTDNLDTMAEKVGQYISGMGDTVMKTLSEMFSVFHAGLFIQNGKYELIHKLVKNNYRFFSHQAAMEDNIFLTEVLLRPEMPKLVNTDIPSLEAHFDPVRRTPTDGVRLPSMSAKERTNLTNMTPSGSPPEKGTMTPPYTDSGTNLRESRGSAGNLPGQSKKRKFLDQLARRLTSENVHEVSFERAATKSGQITPPTTGQKTPTRTGQNTPPLSGQNTPMTGQKTPPTTGLKTPPLTDEQRPPTAGQKTPMTGQKTPPLTEEQTPPPTQEPTPPPTGQKTPSTAGQKTPPTTEQRTPPTEQTPTATAQNTPPTTGQKTPSMTEQKTPTTSSQKVPQTPDHKSRPGTVGRVTPLQSSKPSLPKPTATIKPTRKESHKPKKDAVTRRMTVDEQSSVSVVTSSGSTGRRPSVQLYGKAYGTSGHRQSVASGHRQSVASGHRQSVASGHRQSVYGRGGRGSRASVQAYDSSHRKESNYRRSTVAGSDQSSSSSVHSHAQYRRVSYDSSTGAQEAGSIRAELQKRRTSMPVQITLTAKGNLGVGLNNQNEIPKPDAIFEKRFKGRKSPGKSMKGQSQVRQGVIAELPADSTLNFQELEKTTAKVSEQDLKTYKRERMDEAVNERLNLGKKGAQKGALPPLPRKVVPKNLMFISGSAYQG